FFVQAEDGIRDRTVTGVQTCALPILLLRPAPLLRSRAEPLAPKPPAAFDSLRFGRPVDQGGDFATRLAARHIGGAACQGQANAGEAAFSPRLGTVDWRTGYGIVGERRISERTDFSGILYYKGRNSGCGRPRDG